ENLLANDSFNEPKYIEESKPFPNAGANQSDSSKKKRSSAILTNTPENLMLEKAKAERDVKINKIKILWLRQVIRKKDKGSIRKFYL
ncbi:hypothetical protein HHI36_020317, partial [Cryptolaemus montrouzieri]